MKQRFSLVLSVFLAVTLTACGGGGGDESPVTGPFVQGRWVAGAGGSTTYTAVGLPALNGSAVVWVLTNDASQLAKVSVQGNGTLTGRAYALGQGLAATGIAGQWSSPTSTSITLTGVASSVLTLAQTDALTAAAVQADAAGAWKATAGGNAQTVTWTVAESGAVSGQSTTGCTYAGSLAAMSNASAYTASVKEACSDGVTTQYNGIATLNPAKNALSVVATSADESVGVALFLSK